jgi:hypothetical protein
MTNGVYILHTKPTDELKGYHLEDRATIACKVVGNEIVYGVAICAAGDNFNRKKGREIAIQRMEEGYGTLNRKEGIYANMADDEAALGKFASTLGTALKRKFGRYKKRVHAHNDVNRVLAQGHL